MSDFRHFDFDFVFLFDATDGQELHAAGQKEAAAAVAEGQKEAEVDQAADGETEAAVAAEDPKEEEEEVAARHAVDMAA